MTVDGIIAKNKSHNADWTSKADKKAFIGETKKHGVIIMGDTTFDAMGQKSLPGRLNLILSSQPEKYQDKVVPDQLEFIKAPPKDVVKNLEQCGFESAILGGGARTNSYFLKAGLVDEILITVEPKIFGVGLNFTEGEEFDLDLKLLEVNRLNNETIQPRYRITR